MNISKTLYNHSILRLNYKTTSFKQETKNCEIRNLTDLDGRGII